MSKQLKSTIALLAFVILVLVVYVGALAFSSISKLNDVVPAPIVLDNGTSTISEKTSVNTVPSKTIKKPSVIPVVTPNPTPNPTPVTPPNPGIAMSDVQKHNTQSSCWTVVNGEVYDLTSFVSPHPGGSRAILSLCGIDGTSAFLDEHGSQRRPNNELTGLKIGNLAK